MNIKIQNTPADGNLKFKLRKDSLSTQSSSSPEYEKQITYFQAVDIVKELSGKVFTQLDACITNDRQLKSIKDCIRNDIAYAYSKFYEIADPDYRNKLPIAGVDFDEKDLQEISLEEAIGL
jgi:hypothetical protein